MAPNVLGLFFLLFWTSGLVESIFINEVNVWKEKVDHPWYLSPNLHWRYRKYSGKLLPNYFSDFELKNHRQQIYQPNINFEKQIFRKSRFFIPGLNSDSNSVVNDLDSAIQSIFPKPIVSKAKESKHSNINLNLENNEISAIYYTKKLPENDIKFNAGLGSPIPSKASVLHLESKVDQESTDASISSTSENKIIPSATAPDSSTSQKTKEEMDDVSNSNDSTLVPEINSLPDENSIVADEQNTSVSENLQKETENPFTNNSDTTESFIESDTTEITSNTDFNANSSEDHKVFSTDKASTPDDNTIVTEASSDGSSLSQTSTTPDVRDASENNTATTNASSDGNPLLQTSTTPDATDASEDNTTATNASSDGNPPSQTSTTPGVTQPEKSTPDPISTTDVDKTQSTRNQETTATESIVTSNPITSTDKKNDEVVSTTLPGFTESKPTSTRNEVTEVTAQDHVIEIPSIRTARVIVSVVFIVIALVAVVVLAVYMFRAKRRAAQYDQLMLLP